MRLEYKKIFKQAWLLTKTNKFLWAFGLFLVWGNFFTLLNPDSAKAFLSFAVILGIVFLVLYFHALAGSIIAIKAILDKQETSFAKAFKLSRAYYNRLIGITFSIIIIMAVLVIIIGGPITYLLAAHLAFRAMTLLVLGLAVVIPVTVVAVLINLLAPMFVVIFDRKLKEAISESFSLISKYWPSLLWFGFLLFVISVLVSALTAAPFVLFTHFAYHKADVLWLLSAQIIYGLAALLIQSLLAIFSQTAWVLVFLDLVKPQKIEDEEVVPVPEVA